jgi:hypothetical protein
LYGHAYLFSKGINPFSHVPVGMKESNKVLAASIVESINETIVNMNSK